MALSPIYTNKLDFGCGTFNAGHATIDFAFLIKSLESGTNDSKGSSKTSRKKLANGANLA